MSLQEFKQFMMEDFGGMLIQKFSESYNHSQNDENIIYTLQQAADLLGVSIKTMYSLNNKNEISYMKRAGKCYYSKKAILNYLKGNTIPSKYELQGKVDNLIPFLQ